MNLENFYWFEESKTGVNFNKVVWFDISIIESKNTLRVSFGEEGWL